ncbi:phosphomannomutase/phosphoglucomutase [Entamoeba histolytica HM-3:IMSS]|uniref:Phosphoglucomutase/phosphomannomutase family protein n=4 Tax=Entamoeba histolytica TaxID=5759 RepID=C4M1K5_ENTH1|nr:phosphoglucomutase/phosphomannomutase family protein [Entamoeba histolytica HM-1:IMSS]EAL44721.1 phosphoglucomutase/phosphomannomutase family protein [Entamoeba histolytica HM-1:IMSS]EMD44727.1 phosphomannomutase/phosphoglucomutase, putative [Entamoeba histolytica KU27]EMS11639.1 phosphomannomutase/phosphoglucomutase [Entamoeba histolytica HM-3:IMSS]GAT95103.1 phosphoglucomutase phosphomannomutase family protei [Entamoeba histolytica]|eukprot:XP_650107.1 phosphoglucomutase/phosphomannomutase family protein [Entamoeba histolytica HM-1:IMSS]
MSDPLMVTLSGIRGIAQKSLSEAVIIKYVKAFVTIQFEEHTKNSLFILGRDSRVSGPWAEKIVIKALEECGCKVLNCGIVPTPTVQVMVQQHQASGGIIITSSHNPKPWNGLKFVDSDGLFIVPKKCAKVFTLADEGTFIHQEGGITQSLSTAIDEHLNKILSLPYIDVEAIKKQHFKVAVDSVCGAGGPIMTELLTRLGCEIIPLNIKPTGDFPHIPEPLPENLTDLCHIVKESKADLGIAVDPDVDRCVLIGGDGNPIGEEYTLVCAVYFVLKYCGKKGNVCKNLSSSRATSKVCEKFGSKCYNTPVGEIQVGIGMKQLNAVIGGEGNGGVMLPDVHIGRDAMVASTLTLMLMTKEQKPLKEIVSQLPQFRIYKTKVDTNKVNVDKAFELVKKTYQQEEIDERDGLYVSTKDFWVHLRRSNTEPIVRVIAEAESLEKAKETAEKVMNILLSA